MGTAPSKRSRSKRSIAPAKETNHLQQWMTVLRQDIRENIPIIYLAIPGSHNSMTFEINRKSRLAPDADETVRRLHRLFPWLISRWAKTQNYSVSEQLNYGIRFFDLRISKLGDNFTDTVNIDNKTKKDDIYYFVHALYSGTVEIALSEISDFLNRNPGEIVILDFQHFYEISWADHDELHRFIKSTFGSKIYGIQDGQLSNLTLAQAYMQRKQLIIIYRGIYDAPEYWPGYIWPTPWPQTSNTKTLREFLNKSLTNRQKDCGWVSQCLITPDSAFIAKRFYSSLVLAAKMVMKSLDDWIPEQVPGPIENDGDRRINVIIADFIDLNNSAFPTMVIELNDKIPKMERRN